MLIKSIKIAGLEDILSNLGVSSDIINFIHSLPNNKKGLVISLIKKNPQITLEEIKNKLKSQKEINPYLPDEIQMAKKFPEKARKWILVWFKKLRNSRLDLNISQLSLIPDYMNFYNQLHDWTATNELTDFLRFNPNIDISNHTPEKVKELVDEAHETDDEGYTEYLPTDPSLIMYGPKWKNPEWNGWTIQEIKTSHDLKVESYFMSDGGHFCVGNDYYCQNVPSGNIRIFSLRDPQNKPHVTIESTPSMNEFEQIQGKANSEPKDIYKKMIKEWIIHLKSQGIEVWGEEPEYDNNEDLLETLNQKSKQDEYGRYTNIDWDQYDWHDLIDLLIKNQEYMYRTTRNNEDYRGEMVYAPSILLETAKEKGEKEVYKLIKAAYIVLQENEEILWENWYFEPYFDYDDPDYPETPDSDDYADGVQDIDFKKDHKKWEEDVERWKEKVFEEQEIEELENYQSKYSRYALPMDIIDQFKKEVNLGNIPPFEELENKYKKEKKSFNWYSKLKYSSPVMLEGEFDIFDDDSVAIGHYPLGKDCKIYIWYFDGEKIISKDITSTVEEDDHVSIFGNKSMYTRGRTEVCKDDSPKVLVYLSYNRYNKFKRLNKNIENAIHKQWGSNAEIYVMY